MKAPIRLLAGYIACSRIRAEQLIIEASHPHPITIIQSAAIVAIYGGCLAIPFPAAAGFLRRLFVDLATAGGGSAAFLSLGLLHLFVAICLVFPISFQLHGSLSGSDALAIMHLRLRDARLVAGILATDCVILLFLVDCFFSPVLMLPFVPYLTFGALCALLLFKTILYGMVATLSIGVLAVLRRIENIKHGAVLSWAAAVMFYGAIAAFASYVRSRPLVLENSLVLACFVDILELVLDPFRPFTAMALGILSFAGLYVLVIRVLAPEIGRRGIP